MIRRETKKPKPYDKIEPRSTSSPGVFGRLRRMFSRSPKPSRNPSTADFSNVSNVSNVSNLSVLSEANPNKTLSEFFKSKGDDPLSDIEVEGVLSLINKVHQQNQSQLETFRNSQLIDSQILSSPATKNSESSFFNSTTVLRPASKSPVTVDVPTYTPKVRTISRHAQPFPAIKKRVVEFSSLPSPYRQRIQSPVKPRVEKREPMSRTANKVLSILEQPEDIVESAKEVEKDKVNQANRNLPSVQPVRAAIPVAEKKPIAKPAAEEKQIAKPSIKPVVKPAPAPVPAAAPAAKLLPQPDSSEPEVIEIDSEDESVEEPPQPAQPKPIPQVKPVETIKSVEKPPVAPPAKPAPAVSLFKPTPAPAPAPLFKPTPAPQPEPSSKPAEKPKFTFRPAEAAPFTPAVTKPAPLQPFKQLEVIEKFTFPEVETPASPETPFLPLPYPTVIDQFVFPDVETADSQILNSINPEAVKLYSSVFTF
ncbi:hypothetical protein OGAPHI_005823 [Ogataea philodendri]|uniref:Uncharacterized protein n=1 Tax=Ogataea philodendri TaxID=1378263 RepID=A0A9P8T2B9_9ASCO|nr:uncharacterized protein OGAPHI_005823 [Ogataea philodendri]KAH3662571.1 hypothetical protein OGAPHI_005823 [Ogataea philodendri]